MADHFQDVFGTSRGLSQDTRERHELAKALQGLAQGRDVQALRRLRELRPLSPEAARAVKLLLIERVVPQERERLDALLEDILLEEAAVKAAQALVAQASADKGPMMSLLGAPLPGWLEHCHALAAMEQGAGALVRRHLAQAASRFAQDDPQEMLRDALGKFHYRRLAQDLPPEAQARLVTWQMILAEADLHLNSFRASEDPRSRRQSAQNSLRDRISRRLERLEKAQRS
jgi:hypothetical protein